MKKEQHGSIVVSTMLYSTNDLGSIPAVVCKEFVCSSVTIWVCSGCSSLLPQSKDIPVSRSVGHCKLSSD